MTAPGEPCIPSRRHERCEPDPHITKAVAASASRTAV